MTSEATLFSPVKLGNYELPNRIVMAPMTRLRADDTVPWSLNATYYAQRATAGLIVTECTMVSPLGKSYLNCPGIYTPAQIEGWRLVTDAVHAAGGRIFLQLWHGGRISHPSLLDGDLPVAPSAIAAPGELHTPIGKVAMEAPRALETDEISPIVAQFRQGAENAKAAGFDGIELHGAFGYLIDQFLQDVSNHRADEYGGSIENRSRFLLEVVGAVTEVWGGAGVGIKLSPSNTFYGMGDSNPEATFGYVIQELNQFGLTYIHLMEPNATDLHKPVLNHVTARFRPLYRGTIITNTGYDRDKGNAAIASGDADLVSFGQLFIANPDLPKRLESNLPLNAANPQTFYGQGKAGAEQGYTDYPFLSAN